jgi:hypothetical protein
MLLFIISFIALILLGLSSFEVTSFKPTNDEIRVRDERLSVYPPDLLQIGYYLEAKPEVVKLRKITRNFLAQLDLNLYFFAGHPRERIGVDEYEKFPYILLPIFLIGLFFEIKEKNKILLLFFIPLLVTALDKNQTDNFALFPFFAMTIFLGLTKLPKKYFYVFIAVYLLVMVQVISYEIY